MKVKSKAIKARNEIEIHSRSRIFKFSFVNSLDALLEQQEAKTRSETGLEQRPFETVRRSEPSISVVGGGLRSHYLSETLGNDLGGEVLIPLDGGEAGARRR
ncbi:unnamed protein product [Camellia sinensis]